jgi:uncharacterized protein (UPF0335 family)
MDSASLTVGKLYAFREKRQPGVPFLKVKLLAKVGRGGKVQVRFEDGPFPGLEEYVHTRQLVVPWGERQAFIRDEERLEQIKKAAAAYGDKARSDAVEAILESTGESSAWLSGNGLSMPRDAIERLARRAGLDGDPAKLDPLGFQDRFGNIHLPPQGAEILARAFAAAEPETVLTYIEGEEEEMRARGYLPGERIYHQFLREYKPGFALARQWAGFTEEIEMLRKEIGRLQGLVHQAAADLRELGADTKAHRLLRGLEGR